MTTVAARPPTAQMILLGTALGLAAMFSGSLLDVFMKLLTTGVERGGAGMAVLEAIAWRAPFQFIPLSIYIALNGGLRALRTRNLLGHVYRAAIIFVALLLFFSALPYLPLADAYALSYAAPLFVVALSGPLLKERVGWRRWTAVVAGFLGVTVAAQPEFASGDWAAALMVLVSALFWGLQVIAIRQLHATETTAAIIGYGYLFQCGVALLFMAVAAGLEAAGAVPAVAGAASPMGLERAVADILTLRVPTLEHVAWAAASGLLAGTLQIMLTVALRFISPATFAPLEYSTLIWGAILGWLVFADIPKAEVWIGGAVVVAAGLYIARREARLALARARTAESVEPHAV